MTWDSLQILLIRSLFFIIATVSLFDLLRLRDRLRLKIALMFISLAMGLYLSVPGPMVAQPDWLLVISYVALAIHPFLLLRLVDHFHTVPLFVQGVALIGVLVSSSTVLFFNPLPDYLLLLELTYFVFISAYAVIVFTRAAAAAAGATRWRLRLTAAGSTLTGLAVLFHGLSLLLSPLSAAPIRSALLSFGVLAGSSYYLAFAPPRWLRQMWQQGELHRFLRQLAAQSVGDRATDVLALLCQTAVRAVDGSGAAVARWNEERQQLVLSDGDLSGTLPVADGVIGRAWTTGRPAIARTPGELGTGAAWIADEAGAPVTLVVPVATADQGQGLLLVFLAEPPLFATDDLALLALFAEQSAITLNYAALIASERTTRQHAETLLHTASHLNMHLDLDTALNVMCRETARVLDVPIVAVHLYDELKQELVLAADYGLPESAHDHFLAISRSLTPGRTADIESVTVHKDIGYLAESPAQGRSTEADLRTVVQAAILDNGRFIGQLNIATAGDSRCFTPEELVLLQGIASQASLAIQNARLFRQVRRYADELEQRVAERTTDLQARNDELDAFAHTVAHDLKNPISNIVNSVDLIVTAPDSLDEEGHLCLNYIRQSAQKMQHIVNELLLLARVRDTEVAFQTVDMSHLIDEAQQRLQFLIKEHEVTIELPDSWPAARGYAPWLEEVWVNYLSNAIKYGGRPPYLVLGATPEVEGMVRFWIHDNGPGLSQGDAAQLFKPFTQLEQAQKLNGNGHGLGLSIVYRIVNKLGGEVGVESLPGQGSTFWFTLPSAHQPALRRVSLARHAAVQPPVW